MSQSAKAVIRLLILPLILIPALYPCAVPSRISHRAFIQRGDGWKNPIQPFHVEDPNSGRNEPFVVPAGYGSSPFNQSYGTMQRKYYMQWPND